MSMEEVISKIEANISELENRFKKNNEFIASASSSIDKLKVDRKNAINDSNILNGALQAFNSDLKDLKECLPVSAVNEVDIQQGS